MNRLLRILLPALLLALTSYASQVGKLTGRIIDKTTREGLPGISVQLLGTKMGIRTDVDGNYVIVNIPSGTYSIKFSGVGFHDLTMVNVQVRSDLTTQVDAQLVPEAVTAEELVVTALRPMLQKDLTASREIRTSEEIRAMPIDNLRDVLKLTAGVSGDNFRGGRAGEVSYIVDGVSFVDPMTGNPQGDVPTVAIEELSVSTGGFSAEYGNAQSGVVQQVIKEGGQKVKGLIEYKFSDFDATKYNSETGVINPVIAIDGPIPTYNRIPGSLGFFLAYEKYQTNGRFIGTDSTLNSFTGKLTYNITPQHKLAFTSVYSDNTWRTYRHLWSKPTSEDLSFVPLASAPSALDPWYNNGRLDYEDLNHNSILDPGEDLNGDGVLQSEDLDHNGSLDVHSMYDHTPLRKRITRSFSLDWTHALSKETFYTLRLSRWETGLRSNIEERINEDINGNNTLDHEPWYSIGSEPDSLRLIPDNYRHVDNPTNPTRQWFDANRNGSQDLEDLNGNGLWDWQVYGSNHDLFADANNNGFIDASEVGPESNWMSWENTPFNNTKDGAGFFSYGNGLTYNRARWHTDSRVATTLKGVITSQVHKMHQVKGGVEASLYKIFQYDVDLASGGNVYGERFTVKPHSYGLFAEDKFESEGMIINMGARWDWFDPNYSNYPRNLGNPVVDQVNGGIIKDPVAVNLKSYFSPRLGVSFPFSKRDLLHFNYGRFFQNPRMELLFRNLNFDLTGAFPLIGNANLSPERTTSYEIGVKHLLTSDMSVDLTGFYKDITGLVDTKQVYYSATDWYGLYVNTDYGNIRGLELTFTKRMSNYVGGSANYTYSIAKGKSSTTRAGYESAYYEQIARTTESFLDWDQRHGINVNLQLYSPKGTRYGHPWVNKALESAGVTFLYSYSSGLPFSEPARNIDPPVNNKRFPSTWNVDMRLDKTVNIYRESKATFYLSVYNLFDQRSIDPLYFQDGGTDDSIDAGWYLADQNGDGSPDYDADGRWNDPRVYQRGRTVQVGVQFAF